MSWRETLPVPLSFQSVPAVRTWAQQIAGNPPVLTIDDDYQVEAGDALIIADTALQAITATLPLVADNKGLVLSFKNAGSAMNDLTLDGDGADIDGIGTLAITDLGAATIVSDGTAWWVI